MTDINTIKISLDPVLYKSINYATALIMLGVSLDLSLDDRGNVKANDLDYKTNRNKIFVSGDMRRGQSLVVWAIREGRQVAHSVDKFLMGNTKLPY